MYKGGLYLWIAKKKKNMVIQERKQFPIPQQVVCCRPLKHCVTIAGRDFQYVLKWIFVEASELSLFVFGLHYSSYFD